MNMFIYIYFLLLSIVFNCILFCNAHSQSEFRKVLKPRNWFHPYVNTPDKLSSPLPEVMILQGINALVSNMPNTAVPASTPVANLYPKFPSQNSFSYNKHNQQPGRDLQQGIQTSLPNVQGSLPTRLPKQKTMHSVQGFYPNRQQQFVAQGSNIINLVRDAPTDTKTQSSVYYTHKKQHERLQTQSSNIQSTILPVTNPEPKIKFMIAPPSASFYNNQQPQIMKDQPLYSQNILSTLSNKPNMFFPTGTRISFKNQKGIGIQSSNIQSTNGPFPEQMPSWIPIKNQQVMSVPILPAPGSYLNNQQNRIKSEESNIQNVKVLLAGKGESKRGNMFSQPPTFYGNHQSHTQHNQQKQMLLKEEILQQIAALTEQQRKELDEIISISSQINENKRILHELVQRRKQQSGIQKQLQLLLLRQKRILLHEQNLKEMQKEKLKKFEEAVAGVFNVVANGNSTIYDQAGSEPVFQKWVIDGNIQSESPDNTEINDSAVLETINTNIPQKMNAPPHSSREIPGNLDILRDLGRKYRRGFTQITNRLPFPLLGIKLIPTHK